MDFTLSPNTENQNYTQRQDYMYQQPLHQVPYQNTNQGNDDSQLNDKRNYGRNEGGQERTAQVVSDTLAKDSHGLLLAHLYDYLKANGLEESAKSLLAEANVQTNGTPTGENQILDTNMSMGVPDTFLLEWWSSLWTLQSKMNPNMNQLLVGNTNGNANLKKNPMPPPSLKQGNPNMTQYQQQLKLQQMRLQFQQQQQQQQQLHQLQQLQQQHPQLHSPLTVNGQPQMQAHQQKRPSPSSHPSQPPQPSQPSQISQPSQLNKVEPANHDEAINDYQLNLLMMENQNNMQKRQFMMMKQQQNNQLEQGKKRNSVDVNSKSQMMMQPQQQQLLQQQQQQQQIMQQQLLALQQSRPSEINYQSPKTDTNNGPEEANKRPSINFNSFPENIADDPNLTPQQRNQYNLNFQLQQERLKYIQQQQQQQQQHQQQQQPQPQLQPQPQPQPQPQQSSQQLSQIGNMDFNAPSAMNPSFGGDMPLDNFSDDWLSGMGAGPGFF